MSTQLLLVVLSSDSLNFISHSYTHIILFCIWLTTTWYLANWNYRLCPWFFQECLSEKLSKGSSTRVRKPEAKVLFIVCYYVLLEIVGLVTLTYFEATNPSNLAAISEYFNCHLPGFLPGENGRCGSRPSVQLLPFSILSAVVITQLAFIPMVVLVFTVSFTRSNCEKLRKLCGRNDKH